ncbi:MAG: tRNA preQ1(34) S-adenosylmethionine ribosyltransferase-isomerase QueA [SAR324 cluster bacterium]|nr:tRNA preQ1(34) S-adenosylmethionine ribosyltransferase-isomerase QueA [SAR324 cluster bacterium]
MSLADSPLPPDWNLDSYFFELPSCLVAQNPSTKRDHSRMMLLSQQTTGIEHHSFYEIVDCLPDNAALVINNTKVLPSRLLGVRQTGGKIEALLLQEKKSGQWEARVKRAKRIKAGEVLSFCNDSIRAVALERLKDGNWLLEFENHETLMGKLEQFALAPIPPYIDRSAASEVDHGQDRERYQTCYAQQAGAVAAPTAGLHFTVNILEQLQKRGIPIIEVTLHVGIGTFAPIHCNDIRHHQIHSEYYKISPSNMDLLHQVLDDKRQLIAVGTTCVRVLETLARADRSTSPSGWTNIYIYPPYQFRWVRGLLTNFHLPYSTLILLVAAFYGREKLMHAYQVAIEQQYRYYSYGDCMLIL